MNTIEKNALKILELLITQNKDQISAREISELAKLSPDDTNDAVWYLEDLGAVDALKTIGSAPFNFAHILLKSRGKFLYEEIRKKGEEEDITQKGKTVLERPINPVGSPYGFTEDDWIFTSLRREDRGRLFVVFGLQYKSDFYDSDKLIQNLKTYFQTAIGKYKTNFKEDISLEFEKLEADYGGHLFNSIASKIIGSDIAIFEASDHNPNVMIELGVALTWGISILPLIEKDSKKPPSDISGQTWVKYESSGDIILDKNFDKKLEEMVERAIGKKGKIQH